MTSQHFYATYDSPLYSYIQRSGTLPISFNGHYEHWLKYNGRRPAQMKSMKINRHLRKEFQRNLTNLRLGHKQKSSIQNVKKSKTSISLKAPSKLENEPSFWDLFDDDQIDNSQNWWSKSPLPPIIDQVDADTTNETKEYPIIPPFKFVEVNDCGDVRIFRTQNQIDSTLIDEVSVDRRINFFICSPNSDMSKERIHLARYVWPALRQKCYEKGFELVIHDLCTNYEELSTLSSSYLKKQIETAMETTKNDRFENFKILILLSHKLDEKSLPDTISRADFNLIQHNMEVDNKKIVDIQTRIVQLKQEKESIKNLHLSRENTMTSVSSEFSGSDIEKRQQNSNQSLIESINNNLSALKQELEQLSYQTNFQLFKEWYRPSIGDQDYSLCNERSLIADLRSNNCERRKFGLEELRRIQKHLNSILEKYHPELYETQVDLFQKTVDTILSQFDPKQCLLLLRTFTNFQFSEEADKLKNRLLSKIPTQNQMRFEMNIGHQQPRPTLDSVDILPKSVREHKSYLHELQVELVRIVGRDLERSVSGWFDNQHHLLHQIPSSLLDETHARQLLTELKIQREFLVDSVKNLKSMVKLEEQTSSIETITMKWSDYFNDPDGSSNKVVLTGDMMTGKSMVMTNVIQKLMKKCSSDQSVLIYRFIGLSHQTSSISLLLQSICAELVYISGEHLPIPEDFDQLKALLFHLENLIVFNVTICLDGIENLEDYSIKTKDDLNWLPKKPHFFTMLSIASSNTKFKVLIDNLSQQNQSYSLIEIPDLSKSSQTDLLHHLLNNRQIQLTPDQFETLITHLSSNAKTVGFILSCCLVVQYWSTTSSLPRLGNKIEQNITYFFAKLEDQYTDPLIRRLLGYIAAYNNGPYYSELLDILSIDEIFMKQLNKSEHLTNTQQCFPANLIYLMNELNPILNYTYYNNDHFLTLKFKNTIFNKCATERYLNQKDKTPSYHNIISRYYMNNENDIELFNRYAENDEEFMHLPNYIIKNQLIYGNINQPINCFINSRKLLQLPFCLITNSNSKFIKHICILNFYWLQVGLIELGYVGLLKLISKIQEYEIEDLEYQLLIDTLKLSREVLQNDPLNLPTQLYNRLKPIVTEDNNSKDTKKFANFNRLLKEIKFSKWSKPFRLLNSDCFRNIQTSSGVNKIHILTGGITSMELNETYTKLYVSTDAGVLYTINTIKYDIIQLLNGINKKVNKIYVNDVLNLVILSSNNSLEIWNLTNSLMTKNLEIPFDPFSIVLSQDNQYLSLIFYSTNWLLTIDLKSNYQIIISDIININDQTCESNGEIVVSSRSKGISMLVAIKLSNKAFLVSQTTGELGDKSLKCQTDGSSILKCEVTSTYYILCCKALAINDFKTNIYYLETFSIENCQPMRRITGCFLDNIVEFGVNGIGSHAICSNVNEKINSTDLSIWNLETEEHKHCITLNGIKSIGVIKEFNVIYLTELYNSMILKLNIQSSIQSAKTKQIRLQNYQITHFDNTENYLLIQSDDNTIMNYYNMKYNKYRGRLIKSLNHMISENDMLLVNEETLIILGDRRYSTIAPDCKDVYQNLKIYNLKLKQFTNDLNNLIIYPVRKSEYIVLDADNLLGLSDNRSHMIIWSLSSGQIQQRIRPKPHLFHDQTPESDSFVNSINRSVLFERTESIDKILVSKDQSLIVCDFYTSYLSVFCLETRQHLTNLVGEHNLLHLQISSLSDNGDYLIQHIYNDNTYCLNLNVWATREGRLYKSIKVDNPIISVSIQPKYSNFAVYIEEDGCCFVWFFRHDELFIKKLPGSDKLFANRQLATNAYSHILYTNDYSSIIVSDSFKIYLWTPINGDYDFELSSRFECDFTIHSIVISMNDNLINFTLKNSPKLYTIMLKEKAEMRKVAMEIADDKFKFLETEDYANTSDESDCE